MNELFLGKLLENISDGISDAENDLAGVLPKGAVTGTLEIYDTCPVQERSQRGMSSPGYSLELQQNKQ